MHFSEKVEGKKYALIALFQWIIRFHCCWLALVVTVIFLSLLSPFKRFSGISLSNAIELNWATFTIMLQSDLYIWIEQFLSVSSKASRMFYPSKSGLYGNALFQEQIKNPFFLHPALMIHVIGYCFWRVEGGMYENIRVWNMGCLQIRHILHWGEYRTLTRNLTLLFVTALLSIARKLWIVHISRLLIDLKHSSLLLLSTTWGPCAWTMRHFLKSGTGISENVKTLRTISRPPSPG